jgi:nucleoside-diphosphate-sugar epimerase
MKKAIITGASGLVGRSLAKYLSSINIDVLCLGRQDWNSEHVRDYFGEGIVYMQLEMENISLLSDKISDLNWEVGNDCVFYNFAWGGIKGLTDGSFEDQLRNAISSSLAIKVAKEIGCSKFVNSGTLEETYAQSHIASGSPYSSAQKNYAIAKLACRDMCAMVAYLEKIDYIHTRLSVPLSPDLSAGGFISNTLRKIRNKENYEPAKNNQLYDVISTTDVADAYHLIGLRGKNKADYFIGSGNPTKLNDYFTNFKQADLGLSVEEKSYSSYDNLSFFSTKLLNTDTGFVAKTNKFNLTGMN